MVYFCNLTNLGGNFSAKYAITPREPMPNPIFIESKESNFNVPPICSNNTTNANNDTVAIIHNDLLRYQHSLAAIRSICSLFIPLVHVQFI